MTRRSKKSVPEIFRRLAGVITVAGLLSGCGGNKAESGSTPERTDHAPSTNNLGPAPDFVLPTIDGDHFRLADYAGRVVVVNFWATWCAPCLEEIPAFVELQEKYAPEGLQFVGISVDEEGPDLVRPFVKRLNVNYPIAMDDGKVAASYKGHLVIPSTFVVGRDGLIRSRYIGIVSFDTLVPQIEKLLAESVATG